MTEGVGTARRRKTVRENGKPLASNEKKLPMTASSILASMCLNAAPMIAATTRKSLRKAGKPLASNAKRLMVVTALSIIVSTSLNGHSNSHGTAPSKTSRHTSVASSNARLVTVIMVVAM